MSTALATVDAVRFGPWAVVTGASSGIGREFARQLAANRVNVVLVARRAPVMEEIGADLADRYGVEYRVAGVDLSGTGFLGPITDVTDDLDIGLLVSNAGTGITGRFLTQDIDTLRGNLRLNTLAHLDLTYHFGRRLAARGRGGVILVSAMGSDHGIPNMANSAATKAYVTTLGKGLHSEFARHGVNVSVLLPGPTDTPVLDELNFDVGGSPIKPMPVERSVSEGLAALAANRLTHVPGRLMRIVNALVPGSVSRKMMGRLIGGKEPATVTPSGGVPRG